MRDIESIGDRIKLLRKSLHLSQVEFGARLGIKQNTVACWESGVRTPSDLSIRSISREYKADEEWLRSGSGNAGNYEVRAQEISAYMNKFLGVPRSELEEKIIEFMAKTDAKYWDILLEVMKQIVNDTDEKPPDT